MSGQYRGHSTSTRDASGACTRAVPQLPHHRREAEGETDLDIPPLSLMWKEVFEDNYTLENS
jgi:hypothetical protein